jgi:hypothetical protein
MLLERGMAAEALAQFEAVLQKEPTVQRPGAAASADARATRRARAYSEKLLALAGDRESSRPALAAARQLLATR